MKPHDKLVQSRRADAATHQLLRRARDALLAHHAVVGQVVAGHECERARAALEARRRGRANDAKGSGREAVFVEGLAVLELAVKCAVDQLEVARRVGK